MRPRAPPLLFWKVRASTTCSRVTLPILVSTRPIGRPFSSLIAGRPTAPAGAGAAAEAPPPPVEPGDGGRAVGAAAGAAGRAAGPTPAPLPPAAGTTVPAVDGRRPDAGAAEDADAAGR